MLETLENRIQTLITALIKGNIRKAKKRAEIKQKESDKEIHGIASDIVEEMAQKQAIKNAIVNAPSIFPIVGTIISFWLMGAEALLTLEQSISLILSLASLYGIPLDDGEKIEAMVLEIIGGAYQITGETTSSDPSLATKAYLARTLPVRYFNKGVGDLFTRMFYRKGGLRLIPGGIGTFISASYGYKIIGEVGYRTIRYLESLDA